LLTNLETLKFLNFFNYNEIHRKPVFIRHFSIIVICMHLGVCIISYLLFCKQVLTVTVIRQGKDLRYAGYMSSVIPRLPSKSQFQALCNHVDLI